MKPVARTVSLARLVACVFTAGLGLAASAQEYPSRPITLVIPTTTGTAADITARTFAPRLQAKFGKPVVVATELQPFHITPGTGAR